MADYLTPDIEWTTLYPASQDPDPVQGPGGKQEALINATETTKGHRVRVSHPNTLAQKLQNVAKKAGDASDLPAGSNAARIAALEAAGTGGQTNTVAGATGITNTGNNVDAVLAPTYGSSANEICQGNDSRLSDSRAPTAHDLAGALHNSATLAQINAKVSDANLDDASSSRPPSGSASGQLGGSYPSPDVRGIRETSGPTELTIGAVADGQYLKRSGVGVVGDTPGGASPLTTKGDLFGFSTVDARLPIGSEGQVPVARAAEALGIGWEDQSGGGTLALGGTAAEVVDVIVGSPSTTQSYGTAAWADIETAELQKTFTVETAGEYAFFMRVQPYPVNTWVETYFGLIVDESGYGGFSQQLLRPENERGAIVSAKDTAAPRAGGTLFLGKLTLEAGTHQAEAQWYRAAGDGNVAVGGSCPFHVWCEFLPAALPAAVTAPGDYVEDVSISTTAWPGTAYTGTTWETIGDQNSEPVEGTIQVLSTGKYRVSLQVTCASTATGGAYFRVILNEGLSSEKIIGGDAWWFYFNATSTQVHLSWEGYADDIPAGAVTYSVQWKNYTIDPGELRWNLAASAIVGIEAISGSGAGGTLLATDSLASDYTTTQTATPTSVVTGLSMTIDCSVGERVKLECNGAMTVDSTAATLMASFAVDGTRLPGIDTVYDAGFIQSVATGHASQINFEQYFVATKTQHTITLLANSVGTTHLKVYEGLIIRANQARGGLVPIKQDGVTRTSTPADLDFQFPLRVQSVGGSAKITTDGITDGSKKQVATLASNSGSITSTSLVSIPAPGGPLSLTFVAQEGEIAMIGFNGVVASGSSSANTPQLKMKLDGVEVGTGPKVVISGNGYSDALVESFPVEIATTGTHTLELFGLTANSLSFTVLVGTALWVKQDLGGYVVPDNVPVFERDTSDTSVINAIAAIGASGRMWLSLNDGKRRYVDLPLTCDIDVDGIGGRDDGDATGEAAGDLYHLFAVPSDTNDSQIKLVLSKDAVPGTDGPPSFSVYRYLWTVRIDSISPVVIEKFVMTNDGWYVPLNQEDADYALESATSSTPGTTGSWVDKTTAIRALVPPGADMVEIIGYASFASTQIVFIAGEATPSWTPDTGEPYSKRFLTTTSVAQHTEVVRCIAIPDREFAVWFNASVSGSYAITIGSYRQALYPGANQGATPQTKYLPNPVTASASGPVSLDADDSGNLYTNEGATAEVAFNLPAATRGLEFSFIIQDVDGIQVNAASGDTIRIAASVSAAAGLIEATAIGNAVHLKAINATEWIAMSYVGTWTVT